MIIDRIGSRSPVPHTKRVAAAGGEPAESRSGVSARPLMVEGGDWRYRATRTRRPRDGF